MDDSLISGFARNRMCMFWIYKRTYDAVHVQVRDTVKEADTPSNRFGDTASAMNEVELDTSTRFADYYDAEQIAFSIIKPECGFG